MSHTSRETKQKWMLPEVLDLMEEKNKQIMHIRIKKKTNSKETKQNKTKQKKTKKNKKKQKTKNKKLDMFIMKHFVKSKENFSSKKC